jgi:hypothetical protein
MVKRSIQVVAIVGVLALPAWADARVSEMGSGAPAVKTSCPLPEKDCNAVTRVTGYQVRNGTAREPFRVPRDGYIVAFSIRLANVNDRQFDFFSSSFGGDPRARLAILRKGKRGRDRRLFRLLRQSRTRNLRPFLGSTPTFVFGHPLRVKTGHRVALTVPTWAPTFAVNLGRTNMWRASRLKANDGCKAVQRQAAQQRVGRRGRKRYECDNFGGRLLYSATYVPDPRRTR